MNLIVIPRDTFVFESDGKQYEEVYISHISSNADSETIDEFDASRIKKDSNGNLSNPYKRLDTVTITGSNTKYTAIVDDPTTHPSIGAEWFKEGINKYQMFDSNYTSSTIFSSANGEVTFNNINNTHIIAQNLNNVKEVKLTFFDKDGNEIDESFNCDICRLPETKLSLFEIDYFNCDDCCIPDVNYRTSFVLKLNKKSCSGYVKVRVILTKAREDRPIKIGVLALGRAFDLGCLQKGAEIGLSLPKSEIDFKALQRTGVLPANIETSIKGTLSIKNKNIDEIIKLITRHGNYLNFYTLGDKAEEVFTRGIVFGRFRNIRFRLTSIEKDGYAEYPIDVIGKQS